MKFLAQIDMNSDAFAHEPHRELAAALLGIASKLLTETVHVPSLDKMPVRDINGNLAGYWHITSEA